MTNQNPSSEHSKLVVCARCHKLLGATGAMEVYYQLDEGTVCSKCTSESIGEQIGEADWRVEETLLDKVDRNTLYNLHEILSREALKLMRAKNHDYAAVDDPFRNFRTYGELGILVRLSDKIARLHSFIENKTLAVKNESIRDTTLDVINYAIIFYCYLVDRGYFRAPEKK